MASVLMVLAHLVTARSPHRLFGLVRNGCGMHREAFIYVVIDEDGCVWVF